MPGGWASGEGGHVVGGRYRLVGVIGSGGMGTVWRAHDELLDRPVAAKVLNISFGHGVEDQNRRERSLREARATARINHPNVVRVYDYVEDDDRLWIVMELLDARSLDTVLAEDGPLTPRDAAAIGVQIARALRTVHQHGVLHRDVKPGNVLIEADGHAVLTDFGIAALEGTSGLTGTGAIVGSPEFMAPERIESDDAGPASDLWSLGVTLCAAVTGSSPFRRSTPVATLAAIVIAKPEVPPETGPMEPLIRALFGRDPETRPVAAEVMATLEAVLSEDARRHAADPTVEVAAPTGSPTGNLTESLTESPAGPPPGRLMPDAPLPEVPGTGGVPGIAAAATEVVSFGGADAASRVPAGGAPGAVDTSGANRGTPHVLDADATVSASAAPTDVLPRVPAPPPSGTGTNGGTGTSGPGATKPLTSAGIPDGGSPGGPDSGPGTDPGSDPGTDSGRSGPGRSAPAWWRRRVVVLPAAASAVAAIIVTAVLLSGGDGEKNDVGKSSSPAPTNAAPATAATNPPPTRAASAIPTSPAYPAAAAPAAPAGTPVNTVTENGRFSWPVPQGWKRNEQDQTVGYTDPGGRTTLYARTAFQQTNDLLGVWRDREGKATAVLANYQRVLFEERTIRGQRGVVWESTWTEAGVARHAILAAYIANGVYVEVDVFADESTWQRDEPLFQWALQSITPAGNGGNAGTGPTQAA